MSMEALPSRDAAPATCHLLLVARERGSVGWLRRVACGTIVNSTSVNRKRSEQDHELVTV